VPIEKISTCDGDSGSPIFIQDKDFTWYLGAASFMLGTSNCGRGEWGNSGGIQSFYASYVYEDFIKEASNYLALNKR
jgi:secreted trypsin-like serine protease